MSKVLFKRLVSSVKYSVEMLVKILNIKTSSTYTLLKEHVQIKYCRCQPDHYRKIKTGNVQMLKFM
jgi:hypothetical protein